MRLGKLLGEVRERIGQKTDAEAGDRGLRGALESALEWLAGELRWDLRSEPSAVALVAETREYALPPDCLEVLQAEWNDQALRAESLPGWIRDRNDWDSRAGGDLLQAWAADRGRLFLYPPPSSAAVATDPRLRLRYLAGSPDVSEGGVRGFSDADHWLAVWATAREWLSTHPPLPRADEDPARFQARAQAHQSLLQTAAGETLARLELARKRSRRQERKSSRGVRPPARITTAR